MSSVLILHILAAFVWLGCVLTETVFERVGDGSEVIRRFIAEAHWRIDVFVEIPAFVVVALTGAYMAAVLPSSPGIMIMMTAGLIAVGISVYCTYLVRERLRAAEAGEASLWFELDHQLHRCGAVVLIGVLVALSAGVSLFVAG